MNEHTPTPGPWTYRKPSEDTPNVEYWIDGPNRIPIADIKTNGEPESNAKLIAAAPELYKALKALHDSFQHIDGNTKGNKAKTDIIKYNEDVRLALVATHNGGDMKCAGIRSTFLSNHTNFETRENI
jgi:hypothetical protein